MLSTEIMSLLFRGFVLGHQWRMVLPVLNGIHKFCVLFKGVTLNKVSCDEVMKVLYGGNSFLQVSTR